METDAANRRAEQFGLRSFQNLHRALRCSSTCLAERFDRGKGYQAFVGQSGIDYLQHLTPALFSGRLAVAKDH